MQQLLKTERAAQKGRSVFKMKDPSETGKVSERREKSKSKMEKAGVLLCALCALNRRRHCSEFSS